MPIQNLITFEEIKQYVDIADTLELEYIDRPVKKAQDSFLAGILGDDLYQQLQDNYPENLSYADLALIPKVQPCIAYRSYQLYLETEGIYNTPMGMREYTEDNSNGVSDRRRGILLDRARADAESCELKLQAFLIKNKEDYPLWKNKNLPQVKKTSGISAVKSDRRRPDVGTLGTGRTLRRNA